MKEQPKEDLSREGFLMVLPLKYLDLKAHYKAWLESMLRYVKKDIQSQINDRLNSFDKDFPDPPIDKKLIGTFIYDHENQKEIYTSVEQPKEDKDWKEIPEFFEMKKAIACLYVELPESIANDVRDRFIKMVDAIDEIIQPLQSQNEELTKKFNEANAFICDIAKMFGEDNLGSDGCQWTIDDFREAIENQNEALQKEVDDYKALLSSATTKGQELIEENAELKAEKQ